MEIERIVTLPGLTYLKENEYSKKFNRMYFFRISIMNFQILIIDFKAEFLFVVKNHRSETD